LSGIAVAALYTMFAIRLAPALEGKFAALQRLLVFVALAFVVGGIGLLCSNSTPLPTAGGEDATRGDASWLLLARGELRDLRGTLAMVLFAAAWLMVPLLLVLRPLRSFVLQHRMDLVAREQVAASAGRKAGS